LLDLLVHEKSFARLANEFKGKAADIRPILMSDDGIFRVAGGEVIEGVPQVDLGYGTQDSYFSPAVMTYMQAILGSENLKWFQSSAAGIEHPILLAIRNHADLYTSAHEQSPAIAEWALWAALDWLQIKNALPQADCVILCCPLTSETEGMADSEFFGRMQPNSLFLNVGRGALVDEAALVAALDHSGPEHAALDVTAVEPLPPESALWHHPGITLTAHISALTDRSARRSDRVFINNLERYLNGEPLQNLVEKGRKS